MLNSVLEELACFISFRFVSCFDSGFYNLPANSYSFGGGKGGHFWVFSIASLTQFKGLDIFLSPLQIKRSTVLGKSFTPNLYKYLKELPGKHPLASLAKAAIFSSAHV